jgi:hypothetical protein
MFRLHTIACAAFPHQRRRRVILVAHRPEPWVPKQEPSGARRAAFRAEVSSTNGLVLALNQTHSTDPMNGE